MKNRITTNLSSLLLICITACSTGTQDEILGSWYEIGGTESIQFFKDGSIQLLSDGNQISGNYTFPDENTIRMEFGGLGALAGPMIAEYKIESGFLLLRYSDGTSSRYAKNRVSSVRKAASETNTIPVEEIRQRLQEGVLLAEGAKSAIKFFYLDHHYLPNSSEDVDLPEIHGRYVTEVKVVGGGVIQVKLNDAVGIPHGAGLVITPVDGSPANWECKAVLYPEEFEAAAPNGCTPLRD